MLALVAFTSCDDPGVSYKKLTGNEMNLPEELKGLEVYTVSLGGGNYVRVAVLNNQVNSLTYPVGKTTQNVILLREPYTKSEDIVGYTQRAIVGDVVVENDELIIIRKK